MSCLEIGSEVKLRTCLREVIVSHVSIAADRSQLDRLRGKLAGDVAGLGTKAFRHTGAVSSTILTSQNRLVMEGRMRLRHPVTTRTSAVYVVSPPRVATLPLLSELLADWPPSPIRRHYTRQESIFPSDRKYGRVGTNASRGPVRKPNVSKKRWSVRGR